MYNEFKQKYDQLLIEQFVTKYTSKEKIWAGLVELKGQGIDPLDENFKGSLYNLNSHIFKYLIKSPTDEEKEFLTKLWNFKNGDMQSLLNSRCEETSFGRSLLKGFDSSVKCFERLMNYGTLRELNEFLKENIKFFDESPKFQLFNHELKKVLLCEEAGMKIDFRTLRCTINDESFKTPSKLFDFVSRHKEYLDKVQWDSLVLSMIVKADNINYTGRNNPIADVFFLINQLNNPEELSVSTLLSNNFIRPDKDKVIYFDVKNKSLPLEVFELKWIESIKMLNIDNIITSSSWTKAQPLLEDEIVINSISKSIKKLVLNRFETEPDPEAYRWPLFTSYRGLFQSDVFQPVIIKLIINECSVETNKTLYDLIKGEEKGHKRFEMYEFYQHYLLENPAKNQFLAQILSHDFHSEEFKRIGTKVKIETFIPAKHEKNKLQAKI